MNKILKKFHQSAKCRFFTTIWHSAMWGGVHCLMLWEGGLNAWESWKDLMNKILKIFHQSAKCRFFTTIWHSAWTLLL